MPILEGSSHHLAVGKHQQSPHEKHPPILASPTPFVPQKSAPVSQPSFHTAHLVIEDVTVRPSFHPHTLPPPRTPSAPPSTSAFLSFPPKSQASTSRPQPVGATKGFPDIKPFIQLGPTAPTKPSLVPQHHIHQNSISFAPPSFSPGRAVPAVEQEPVHVFHHGSPLFLSQIRSIQVTSEPPTLFTTNLFPTATPRNLDSLAQQKLQVFGPETASMQHTEVPEVDSGLQEGEDLWRGRRFLLSWRLNQPKFTWAEVSSLDFSFLISHPCIPRPSPSASPGRWRWCPWTM